MTLGYSGHILRTVHDFGGQEIRPSWRVILLVLIVVDLCMERIGIDAEVTDNLPTSGVWSAEIGFPCN